MAEKDIRYRDDRTYDDEENIESPQRSRVAPGKRTLTALITPVTPPSSSSARPHRPTTVPVVQAKRDAAWWDTLMRPDRCEPPADTPGPKLEGSGTGRPMPAPIQAKMERAFGADFSAVRVHEGPEAASIGAAAYTRGTDIHFAPGRYDPGSQSGQELLGHELTHVVQQARGRVAAPVQPKGGLGINSDSSLELEADDLGARAARGETVSVGWGGAAAAGAIQRKGDGKAEVSADQERTDEPNSAQPGHLGQVLELLRDARDKLVSWIGVAANGVDEKQVTTRFNQNGGIIDDENDNASKQKDEGEKKTDTHDAADEDDYITAEEDNYVTAEEDNYVTAEEDDGFTFPDNEEGEDYLDAEDTDDDEGYTFAEYSPGEKPPADEEKDGPLDASPGQPQPRPQQPQQPQPPPSVGNEAFEALDHLLSTIGNVGTEGGNNFGGVDQQFNQLCEGWQSSKAGGQTSGGADVSAGVVAAISNGYELGKKLIPLIETLRDPKTSAEEKSKAALEISQMAAGSLQSTMVTLGGALTALEKSGGNTKSAFGLTTEGGNMASTDAKMVGDFAGAISGLLVPIGAALEAVNTYRRTADQKGKEAAGTAALGLLKVVNGLSKAARTAGNLAGQIKDGGQIVTGLGKEFQIFAGQAVPGLGSVVALGDIARQSYNIHKYAHRRKALAEKLESLSGEKERAAIQYAITTLGKRINRASLSIALSSVNLVGDVTQLATPAGTAVGTAIKGMSSGVNLANAMRRRGKQKLRDRLDKKRQERGDTQTYENWKKQQVANRPVIGWLETLFTSNWDKSTAKKAAEVLEHAQTIVKMADPSVYKNIGLELEALEKKAPEEHSKAVVEALKKR